MPCLSRCRRGPPGVGRRASCHRVQPWASFSFPARTHFPAPSVPPRKRATNISTGARRIFDGTSCRPPGRLLISRMYPLSRKPVSAGTKARRVHLFLGRVSPGRRVPACEVGNPGRKRPQVPKPSSRLAGISGLVIPASPPARRACPAHKAFAFGSAGMTCDSEEFLAAPATSPPVG